MEHDEVDIRGRGSGTTHDGAGHEGKIGFRKTLFQKPLREGKRLLPRQISPLKAIRDPPITKTKRPGFCPGLLKISV